MATTVSSRRTATPSRDMTAFIHMGTLSRPHGIRGELCVQWYADSPDLLRGVFYLQAGDEPPRRVEGAAVRLHRGQPLLTLPHVSDRTAAEGLRGVRILVERAHLPPLDEDEAYLHDIIGADVVDDTTGLTIGVLEHVEFLSEQDVWVIRTPDGREVLFPAAPELIAGFDAEARTVHVVPPPGLLDIYLSS